MSTQDGLVVQTFQAIQAGIGAAAEKLGDPTLDPASLNHLTLQLYRLSELVTDLQNTAKARVKDLVLKLGKTVTEGGSKRLDVEGWTMEVRPQRTGIDGRKLEKLLRAKGLPVATYMEPVMTFKYDEERAGHAIINGHLTEAELATCKYDEAWAVQQPRRTE